MADKNFYDYTNIGTAADTDEYLLRRTSTNTTYNMTWASLKTLFASVFGRTPVNIGGENEIYKQTTTSNSEFRTLKAGTNVTITQNANDIEIASSGGSVTLPFYDAKVDYSATGDGSTDDTTALQNALNAASSNKKPLFIPAGTYMTDPLYVSSDTMVFGAGMGLTTIKLIGGQVWGGALDYNAVITNETIKPSDFGGSGARDEHIYIFDLTIDGNKSAQSGTSSEAECLSLYGAQDCYFDRLELINAYADGYDLDYCDRIGAGFIKVDSAGKTGVHFSTGSPQGVIKGNDHCWIDTVYITNSTESGLTDTYYGGKGYYNHFGFVYVDTCGNESGFKGVTLGGISGKIDNLVLLNVTGDGLEINNQSVNASSNYNTVGKATFGSISGTDWQVDGGTGYFWENSFGSGNDSLINLSTGLIEAWDMNETSGVRYGMLGNINLTDNNTVTYVAGSLEGNAAAFASVNSEYLSATSTSAINQFRAVSFWVRFNTIGGSGLENGMIGKDTAGDNEGDMYVTMNNGEFVFAVQGTTPISITSSISPTIDTWYHVVCSIGDTTAYMYIDGEVVGTDGTFVLDMSSNTNPLTIGARSTSGEYLNGYMDMVQLWNRHINIYEARALKTLGLQ